MTASAVLCIFSWFIFSAWWPALPALFALRGLIAAHSSLFFAGLAGSADIGRESAHNQSREPEHSNTRQLKPMSSVRARLRQASSAQQVISNLTVPAIYLPCEYIVFDYEGSRSEFLKILAEMGEEPAFLERARAHQDALTSLLTRCTAQRNELLEWPRRHFTALRHSVADDWDRLATMVSNPEPHLIFNALAADLPELDTPSTPWLSTKRSLLISFIDSSLRFNRSWERFLGDATLDDVNCRREEYNKYFPIEKSCAFGFDSINHGFEPLPMLDDSYLLSQFPLLPSLSLTQ